MMRITHVAPASSRQRGAALLPYCQRCDQKAEVIFSKYLNTCKKSFYKCGSDVFFSRRLWYIIIWTFIHTLESNI